MLLALSQAERMRRRLKDNDDLHQTWNQFEEATNKTLDWDTRPETGPPNLPGSDFWDFVSTVRDDPEKLTNAKAGFDDYLAPGTLVSDRGTEGMYMGFKKNTFGANEHTIRFDNGTMDVKLKERSWRTEAAALQ